MNLRSAMVRGAILGVALGTACAEVPTDSLHSSQFEPPGAPNLVTAEHAVTVRTRFVLVGFDALGDEASLESLYVNVGSLFLDPADASSVAFASREPFSLEFDVASGKVDLLGPELELPFGGQFYVSVQIVPGDTADADKSDGARHSVVARGRYLEVSELGLRSDEPSPLPWQPKATTLRRTIERQREFTYQSDASARMQLGEVLLREGSAYELVHTVNVAEWLREDVLPLVHTRASEQDAPSASVPAYFADDEPIELDATYEDDGTSATNLVGDIDLGTRRF